MMNGWNQNQKSGDGALPARLVSPASAYGAYSGFSNGYSALAALLAMRRDGAKRGWSC